MVAGRRVFGPLAQNDAALIRVPVRRAQIASMLPSDSESGGHPCCSGSPLYRPAGTFAPKSTNRPPPVLLRSSLHAHASCLRTNKGQSGSPVRKVDIEELEVQPAANYPSNTEQATAQQNERTWLGTVVVVKRKFGAMYPAGAVCGLSDRSACCRL